MSSTIKADSKENGPSNQNTVNENSTKQNEHKLEHNTSCDDKQISNQENDQNTESENCVKRTFGKINNFLTGLTVEPVLFVHNVASSLVWITSQDLMKEKACYINLEYDANICEHLKNHPNVTNEVTDLVSDTMMWKSIFETAIKVLWVLYLGTWSDKWGRKMPLIISIAGLMGEPMVYLGLSHLKSWPLDSVIVSSIPYAFSGGTHALLMLCFSIISDASSKRKRTLRVGLLDSAYYLGSPIGMAILDPLRKWGNYDSVFGFVICIYFLTLIYVILWIKDNETNNMRRDCWTDFGIKNLWDALQVTFKWRPNEATFQIVFLIIAMLFDSMPVWGAGNIKYLFTQKALGWTYTEYSHWGTLSSSLTVIGALVIVPLCTQYWKLSDLFIGSMGALSRLISNVIYGTVFKPSMAWVMYLGAVMGTGSPLCPIGIRALLSKLSGENQIGQVYAVLAMLECFLPFIAAPTYNAIFDASNKLPGSYNFLSAFLNSIILACFWIVYRSMKHYRTPLENSELDTST